MIRFLVELENVLGLRAWDFDDFSPKFGWPFVGTGKRLKPYVSSYSAFYCPGDKTAAEQIAWIDKKKYGPDDELTAWLSYVVPEFSTMGGDPNKPSRGSLQHMALQADHTSLESTNNPIHTPLLIDRWTGTAPLFHLGGVNYITRTGSGRFNQDPNLPLPANSTDAVKELFLDKMGK